MTIRLSGQPQYAERANHLASWLLPRLDSFRGDLWATRGLVEAVVATRDAYEDPRVIPQALREDYVRRQVAGALAARVHGDNVDHNVLATAGTYAALRALHVDGHEALRTWLAEKLDGKPASVVAQALILVPELRTAKRCDRVLAAATSSPAVDDDERLLTAYAAALFAEREPGLLSAAAAEPSLGLIVQAELLRAVARNPEGDTSEIVGLAASVRERIDRLAAGEGGLEAVCVGNAALIALGAPSGHRAERHDPRPPAGGRRADDREHGARTGAGGGAARRRPLPARRWPGGDRAGRPADADDGRSDRGDLRLVRRRARRQVRLRLGRLRAALRPDHVRGGQGARRRAVALALSRRSVERVVVERHGELPAVDDDVLAGHLLQAEHGDDRARDVLRRVSRGLALAPSRRGLSSSPASA